MTNKLKTLQCPRVVLVATGNSRKLTSIISDVMNYCTYNTLIDDFSENTDFVIESEEYDRNCPENAVADTVIFDNNCSLSDERLRAFRERITSYENSMKLDLAEGEKVTTYSSENYGADVACRNLTYDGGKASCDLIGNGILSRLTFDSRKYTADEILACTGVLLAAGMPMAAILNYFSAN